MPIRKYYYRGGTGGAQGRWKHPAQDPVLQLQIMRATGGGGGGGRTSPYQRFQQMMPEGTAAAIANSGKGQLMANLPTFNNPTIDNLSFKQLNDFHVNNGMMSQNITTDGGDLNPWLEAHWVGSNANPIERRKKIIEGLGEWEIEALASQSNAWEPPVTTPTDLTIA